MTDFRALCAELLEAWEHELGDLATGNRLANRARAALAEPEPEGPTLAEIDDLCAEHSFNYEDSESLECLMLIITDALARWGNHPGSPDCSPLPIPVSERLPGAEPCWWFTPEGDEEYGWWILEPDGIKRHPQPTHWLPAHALPLPSGELLDD